MTEEIINEGQATIGTTPVFLLNSRSRIELVLCNIGISKISLSFGANAQSLYGITLYPGMTYSSDRSVTSQRIAAISDVAGGILTYMER